MIDVFKQGCEAEPLGARLSALNPAPGARVKMRSGHAGVVTVSAMDIIVSATELGDPVRSPSPENHPGKPETFCEAAETTQRCPAGSTGAQPRMETLERHGKFCRLTRSSAAAVTGV